MKIIEFEKNKKKIEVTNENILKVREKKEENRELY